MSTSFITVPHDGSSLRLRVHDTGGGGSPVVLVHPWPQRLEMWQAQRDALVAAGHRVVSYDRAGFGESDPAPNGEYDYEHLTEHLAGLMESLDLRDATLVGWSMGGGEVARYAGEYGTDRLRGVVFLAAIPPFLMKTADNPEGPLPEGAWREGNDAIAADRDGFLEGIVSAFFSVEGESLVSEETRQQALEWALSATSEGIAGCQKAFCSTDFRADLAKLDVPAAVIHGDADVMVPVEVSGARTHRDVPGSMFVLIEGAPHGLGVTHAQEVNDALLAFLREAPARP